METAGRGVPIQSLFQLCVWEMLISLPFWAETAAQLVEVEHLLLFDAPLSRALCGLEKDSGEDRNASQQLTVWLVGFCLGLSFCFKQMF